MARPGLESNPAFREMLNRAAPVKTALDDAKAQCDAIMLAAKNRVENDRLAIVRFGLENGLSKYAVSKVWGITAGPDQDKLVAAAMGASWLPESKGLNGLPHVVIEQDGWTALLVRMWRTNHDRFATDWQVTWPEGELLFTHEEDQWYLVPENLWHVVPDNLMPDELFFGMRAWKPEN